MPGPKRERRQTKVLAPAKGRAMVENNARSVRHFSCQEEGQLLQSPVQPIEKSARAEEGHLCCSRLNAHRHLPYAQGRRRTP